MIVKIRYSIMCYLCRFHGTSLSLDSGRTPFVHPASVCPVGFLFHVQILQSHRIFHIFIFIFYLFNIFLVSDTQKSHKKNKANFHLFFLSCQIRIWKNALFSFYLSFRIFISFQTIQNLHSDRCLSRFRKQTFRSWFLPCSLLFPD